MVVSDGLSLVIIPDSQNDAGVGCQLDFQSQRSLSIAPLSHRYIQAFPRMAIYSYGYDSFGLREGQTRGMMPPPAFSGLIVVAMLSTGHALLAVWRTVPGSQGW